MKKMKKIAATLLCIGVAISTLCACSSTGNGGEQPVEETTTKQTEAVTEATEPSTELTESETTEPETPEGDVIIPLYCEYRETEIRPLLNTTRPVDDVTNLNNFDMFCYYFYPVTPTGNDWNGLPTNTIGAGTTFSLASALHPETRTDVSLYFFAGGADDNKTSICFDSNGTTGATDGFIPLWYNQTTGYLVGYSVTEDNGVISYSLREIGYSLVGKTLESHDLTSDPSIYGF